MKSIKRRFRAHLPASHLKRSRYLWVIVLLIAASINGYPLKLSAQVTPVPLITYTSPQAYVRGTTISALAPVNKGGVVAPFAYNNTAITFGGISTPVGVAVDIAGNVYVADQIDNRIYKISADRSSTIILGSGFSAPVGVAVDQAGNVYVADYSGNGIKKIPAGGGAAVPIGSGVSAPWGVAVDAAGNVYVTDKGDHAVKMIPADGSSTVTLAGTPGNDPTGIALDANGNVYVTDLASALVYEIPAGGGSTLNLGYLLNNPTAVAVDTKGNVFVTDSYKGTINMIPPGGGAALSIGSSSGSPIGVALDNTGNLYMVDYGAGVNEFKLIGSYYISPALPAGLHMNIGNGVITGTPTALSPPTDYTITAHNHTGNSSTTLNLTIDDLPAISYSSPQTYNQGSQIPELDPVSTGIDFPGYGINPLRIGSILNHAASVAIGASGILYVGNSAANTVVKIPPGLEQTAIGSGFSRPYGVAVDVSGNVYVADYGNNAVKKIPWNGSAPVTIGSGFSHPTGVAVDAAGNVYVADYGNNRVMEIPIAGGPPVTLGSGVTGPFGIAIDIAGNLYVSYHNSNAVREMKAGTSTLLTIAIGFNSPDGIAVDISGNVFVADAGNHAIMEIPAGGGSPFALSAVLNTPMGVAVDAKNNLFVVDEYYSAVKEFHPVGGYYISSPLPAGLSINTSTGAISGTPTVTVSAANYSVTAFNAAGSVSTTINITVTNNLPIITYSGPQNFNQGVAITPLTPVNTGVAVAPAGYSSAKIMLSVGVTNPYGVAVDGLGNVYVADRYSNTVVKIPAGGGSLVTAGSGFIAPQGLAVDAAGNVYVTDAGNGTVNKLVGGAGSPVVISSGFVIPSGVTVDAAGNLYVTDSGAGAGSVSKIPAGGGAKVVIKSGFSNPQGIAADANGNIYVADANIGLKEIPAGGGNVITLAPALANPFGVAVDAANNLFVANGGSIYKITAGSGKTTIGTGFNSSYGVATDGIGNVYATDNGNNIVFKIRPTGGYYVSPRIPAGLSFSNNTGTFTGTPTTSSPATDYTVTAYGGSGSSSTIVDINIYSNNADLSALLLSDGTLTPAFAAGTISYTATVSNATASITLTPKISDAYGAILVNGAAVISGTPSAAIALNIGPNPINTMVKASNGINTKTYTVTVTRLPSSNAALASLKITNSVLTPAFSSANTSYATTVGNAITSVMVTPTTSDPGASVTINGTTVASGSPSGAIALTVGTNNLSIVVTAADGVSQQTYTIAATRATSNNASLSNLTTNNGALSPPFAMATASYAQSVAYAVSSITLTPTAANSTATITVNGTAVSSGTPSAPIALNVGANVINTVVTASDGLTIRTYKLTVTRGAPSTNAGLANLAISSGVLTPAFAVYTLSYTASVPNTVSSITITPSTGDANATVAVNGTTITPGNSSPAIALVVGYNAITTVVTAQDGVTVQSYTITVLRPSTNANLSGLRLSNGAVLSPAFAGATTTSYTASVANAVTSIIITPTTAQTTSTVKVNGATVTSGSPSNAIALSIGANTINAIVTAQDGVTTKTYTVTVTRAASANVNLASLKISAGTLIQSADGASYTVSETNNVTSITLTPTAADNTATINIDGTTLASGTAWDIAIPVGYLDISFFVIAQDGITKKNYSISIYRAAGSINIPDVAMQAGGLRRSDEGITVHQSISPNGDGINDFLVIDGITKYPDNKLTIINRAGAVIFETKGYDNHSKIFNGSSGKTGAMQSPGTYFYSLEYMANGTLKHKTGYIILKY